MQTLKNTNNVTIAEYRTIEEFLSLKHDWTRLLQRSRQNSVFMSWEWHYTWWEYFAKSNDKLRIVVIKSDEDIIGLAPFYFQHTVLQGTILRFIGTGEAEADEVVSEYLDIITQPGHEQKVSDALYNWINSEKGWRKIEFNNVLDSYLCVQIAERLKQKHCLQSILNGRVYYTPLESSETEYRETRLTSSRNKRLKRCLNALEKDGGGLVRKAIENEADIEANLDVLKSLHDQRWAIKNKSSIFDSPFFRGFHRKLLQQLVPQGKASIAVYYLNDKPLSAIYVMYSKVDCHYYQSGFSKEGENRFMPLFVSHINEMNVARDSGYTNYDFMRGGTCSYKTDFGCDATAMFDLKIYRYDIDLKLVNCTTKLLTVSCKIASNVTTNVRYIRGMFRRNR